MQAAQDQTRSAEEPVIVVFGSQPSYFLRLPYELLLQVMCFLSMGSIRNLMVNRSLRATCEKSLYTSIFLGKHPYRSLRLLETFIIRPDLALLVRHLEFSASYCDKSPYVCNEVPEVLKPDGTNALSMAKNIRSLSLVGPRDWIYRPKHTGFRDAVSKMKLTHLKVEGTVDATTWLGATHVSVRFRYWDGDYAEEIRKVLQAQPLLESLSFVGCSFSEETVANLRSHLARSDVPRLKSLTGIPDIAVAFIGVLPGLEYLNIIDRYWTEERVTSMEKSPATNRASVSRLSVQIGNPDKEFWKRFGRILALFSNTVTLQLQVVVTMYNWSPDAQFEPGEDYFSTIINAISPLSALRHLEIAGEMLYPVKEGIADGVQESFIAKCKIACQRLESFIDHRGRLWGYRFNSDGGGAGSFKQVGVVEKVEDRGPKDDFPYYKGKKIDEEDEEDGSEDEDEGDAREKGEEHERAEDEGDEGDENADHE